MNRNRFIYFLLITATIIAGLSSRHFANTLPQWIHSYFGDTLWALMVFLLFGFIFHRKSSRWVAFLALLFSFSIEISQLYHAFWIDSIRANRIGGLILGFGFLWSDLICYTVGIGLGYLMEIAFSRKR